AAMSRLISVDRAVNHMQRSDEGGFITRLDAAACAIVHRRVARKNNASEREVAEVQHPASLCYLIAASDREAAKFGGDASADEEESASLQRIDGQCANARPCDCHVAVDGQLAVVQLDRSADARIKLNEIIARLRMSDGQRFPQAHAIYCHVGGESHAADDFV